MTPRLSRRAVRALCSMDVVMDEIAWTELVERGVVDKEHKLTAAGFKARERCWRLGFHLTAATSREND